MPTSLPWITLAAGLLLIIVGLLGGGIEIKEVKIPTVPPIPRVASFIVGCVLSGLVLYPTIFAQTPTEPQKQTEAPELGAAIKRHLIDVYGVKKVLQHVGMYNGQINNEPNDEYFTAVANFQRSRNLALQDGLVGGETFGKLRDAWPEYFGSGTTPPAITPTPSNSASNVPDLPAPATTASASKSNPPVIYNTAVSLRIHYVNEKKDFAEKLSSYLSSKGYSASAIYDDFSEISPWSREKSGTIRIVYKSTVQDVEPKLVQAIRDRFSADIGRLVEIQNNSAAADLQIQLW
jgi:hypothetical protein